ncbi:MAG: PAS domain S-box protein, partial [bacterium]|nr:PAS domain S-box protein [bacterium]
MDNTRPSRQQLEQEIAELRRHIETHEQLFLHAVDPIYRFNLITSEYDYWSPSCINTHGYTPEEMISGGIEKEASCIHPDDSILLQKHIDELLSESVGQDFQQIIEYRFKHKTRGYRWLSDSRALLRDTDGSPLAIIGEVRDITARKQTEEKLQETQNFLQAAVAQSPTGIIIADAPDATIRLANQAAFGFDARKGDSRLLTNADIAQYAENWQTLHADGSPYPREELPLSRAVKDGVVTRNKEVILRDNEGHDRWASINAAPIRNAEGEIIAGIVIFNNITERKQVEQAMRQSEQRFRTFMEQSTSAIEIYEPDGKMSLVNDAWTKLWNLKKEDMADYNIFGDPQCETTGLTPAFRDALQGNSRIIPDVAYDPNDSSFKKGRKRWIRPRIYPITDRAGTIQNVVLAYDDITEQRHLEEQLRQSQKMEAVGQLAGGIAHDFNNILTSILGNTELLKMDLPSGCEQVEFVDEVIKSATRAAALTKQLLTFARKGKQQVVPVNIHDLATQTGRMLTHSIDRLIDIRMELNASQNTIMGDPTQLHSAMLNLGLNA